MNSGTHSWVGWNAVYRKWQDSPGPTGSYFVLSVQWFKWWKSQPRQAVVRHYFKFPLNPFPAPPPTACFLHLWPRLWFSPGLKTWHISCQSTVEINPVTGEASGSFVAAALRRPAASAVRLLGFHLTLRTGAVFPHKLNPSPWACLYEIRPHSSSQPVIYQGQPPTARSLAGGPECNPALIHPDLIDEPSQSSHLHTQASFSGSLKIHTDNKQ